MSRVLADWKIVLSMKYAFPFIPTKIIIQLGKIILFFICLAILGEALPHLPQWKNRHCRTDENSSSINKQKLIIGCRITNHHVL